MEAPKETNSRQYSQPFTADQIREHLEGVLASRALVDSPRLREFLSYIVNETLAGRAARIKGFTIAHDVFQREDAEEVEDSTVVRVEAGRLRRRLDEHYAGDGKEDQVRIRVPKGGYAPTFEANESEGSVVGVGASENSALGGKAWIAPGRWKWITIAAVLLVATGLLSVFLAGQPDRSVSSAKTIGSSASTGIAKPSIAVLPFNDATSDGSGAPLATGLAEDIITDLSKLSGVDVIALSSVMSLEDPGASPKEIEAALNVSHVMRGSIRGTRAKLRVTAQLFESATSRQLWAQRFDRPLEDELALENELARRVVESMSINLREPERGRLSRNLASDGEAYDLFKQGIKLGNPPTNASRLTAAMRVFQGVVEMNPEFAGGYAGGAYMRAFYAYFGHSPTPKKYIATAINLAEKALARDADFGLAHTALAFAYLTERDFDKALAASRKAVELQPSDPYVSAYHGVLLCFNGNGEDGIPYARRALRLDPLSPRTPYLNILGTVLFQAGDYEAALKAKVRSIERGGPESPGNQAYRAALFALTGRDKEARETYRLFQEYRGKFDFEAWLRRSFKHEADVENVMRPLRELAEG